MKTPLSSLFCAVLLLIIVIPPQTLIAQTPTLNEAKILFADKQYEETIVALRAVLQRDSINPIAMRLLGDTYMAMDNAESAIPVFERLITFDSTNLYARLVLAKIFRERKQYEKSLPLYLYVYRNDYMTLPGVAVGIADVYMEQRLFDSALIWYQRVFQNRNKPASAGVYLQIARCFAELQDVARAGDAYTSTVTLAPTNVAYLLERIDYWMKQGQIETASYNVAGEYTNQALSRFPHETRFYRRRAEALLQLRRPQAAYSTLKTCVVLGDSVAEVWRDLGISSMMLKQHSVADSLFNIAEEKFMANDEKDSRLYYFRGLVKRELGMYPEALRYLQLALNTGGKNKPVAEAHVQIALTLRKIQETKSAANYYSHAIATDSTRPDFYYELATLYDDPETSLHNEALRRQRRELVAPLYFKFLEHTKNKNQKTVEHTLTRLTLLGITQKETEKHYGWLPKLNPEPDAIKTTTNATTSSATTSSTAATNSTTSGTSTRRTDSLSPLQRSPADTAKKEHGQEQNKR